MRILRIERPDGTGPYNTGDYRLHDLASCRTKHPMPEADSKIASVWSELSWKMRDEYFFGFKGHGQYRAWFYSDEMLEVMAGLNLELVEFEVDAEHVVIGNAQVIFKREHAVEINRKSLMGTNAEAPL